MNEMTALVFLVLLIASAMVTLVGLVLRHRKQVRELLSRERLAALEKGVEIPWEMDLRRPRRVARLHLKSGVLLVGAGAGMTMISALLDVASDATIMLAWGIFLLTLGATNIVYDVLVGRKEWERSTALDEALMHAYIRRLEGRGPESHDGGAEDRAAGR
jgi:hypothetical protein